MDVLHNPHQELDDGFHVAICTLHLHVAVGEVASENNQDFNDFNEEALVVYFHPSFQLPHEYLQQGLLADLDLRHLVQLAILLALRHEKGAQEQLHFRLREQLVKLLRVFGRAQSDWHERELKHAVLCLNSAARREHLIESLLQDLLLFGDAGLCRDLFRA